ncbi:AAA family ATPase [Streptomyces sp. NPDC047017]|uniref:helix-turn-helix transcriptional regulator n=1 Tax=Streptomyces sp. NPDC047017 TaxID=3155024 RepID=UPI0034040337
MLRRSSHLPRSTPIRLRCSYIRLTADARYVVQGGEQLTSMDRIGRARERARLRAVIDRAHGGRGPASVVVRGERGIGKSVLLGEFASLAADAGFRVAAVAGRNQPGDPLGAALRVVSRLEATMAEPAGGATHANHRAAHRAAHRPEPDDETPPPCPGSADAAPHRRASADEPTAYRSEPGDDLTAHRSEPTDEPTAHRPEPGDEPVRPRSAPSGQLLCELVESVCRQAARTPVAICLDDIGHLDPWSLHWLASLHAAASDLPLVIALTGGNTAEADQDPAAAALAADTEHLELTGLEPDEVGAFAAAYRDVALDAPTATLCHELTGGNPALLLALLTGHTGTAPTADDLRETAASAVLPGAERWLAGLGGPALALARAVAVLGPHAEITQCAELAGLSVREALPLVDELVARSLFANRTPLSFRHPLLAGMVINRVPAGTRAALHLTAAGILRDGHFGATRVARQLVAAGPLGLAWTVRPIRLAANQLEREGRHEEAARHLRGMLRERLRPRDRSSVQRQLAALDGFVAPDSAVRRLDAARREADDPRCATDYAVALGTLLAECGQPEDAVAVLDDTAERLAPAAADQRWRLRLYKALTCLDAPTPALSVDLPDGLAAQAPPDDEAQRELSVLRAVHALREGTDRDAAVGHARGALTGSEVPSRLLWHGCQVLIRADELADAWTYCSRARLPDQPRPGTWADVGVDLLRALVLRARGDLTAADTVLTPLADLLRPAARAGRLPATLTVAALAEVRAQTGDTDAALALLADCALDGELPPRQDTVAVLAARARVREQAGDTARALEDLYAAGRLLADSRVRNPAVLPWRSRAARLLASRGDLTEASAPAAAEWEDARRWATPRAIGTALHALALTETGERRVRRLASAVETLAHSPARLELACARRDLGAALSEAGRADTARTEFRAALSLAESCGAQPLVRRILTDRERLCPAVDDDRVPPALSGLTPQEQRILGLARAGHTNRAIAGQLFVTVRTVEFHLSGAYRKLGISGRDQLADVIPAPLGSGGGRV